LWEELQLDFKEKNSKTFGPRVASIARLDLFPLLIDDTLKLEPRNGGVMTLAFVVGAVALATALFMDMGLAHWDVDMTWAEVHVWRGAGWNFKPSSGISKGTPCTTEHKRYTLLNSYR